MNMRRQTIRLLTCLAMIAATGCGAPRSGDDLTGVDLELFVRADQDSFARYRVEPDGTLSYGGGIDAALGKFTWTGSLTESELEQFKVLLQQNRQYRNRPEAPDRPMDTVEYTIRLNITRDAGRPSSGTRVYTVTGTCETLEPLHQLLQSAAMRRNADILNRLPQPSGDQE